MLEGFLGFIAGAVTVVVIGSILWYLWMWISYRRKIVKD